MLSHKICSPLFFKQNLVSFHLSGLIPTFFRTPQLRIQLAATFFLRRSFFILLHHFLHKESAYVSNIFHCTVIESSVRICLVS